MTVVSFHCLPDRQSFDSGRHRDVHKRTSTESEKPRSSKP